MNSFQSGAPSRRRRVGARIFRILPLLTVGLAACIGIARLTTRTSTAKAGDSRAAIHQHAAPENNLTADAESNILTPPEHFTNVRVQAACCFFRRLHID